MYSDEITSLNPAPTSPKPSTILPSQLYIPLLLLFVCFHYDTLSLNSAAHLLELELNHLFIGACAAYQSPQP